MNRHQLEKLYEVNGLTDYQLKNANDLLKTHGIDFRQVDGYARLDDLNRQLYEKFVVAFFNQLGLDSRATLVPKGIFFAESFDYLVKGDPNDDYYFNVAGGCVMVIDRNGLKTVHRTWSDPDYAHLEATTSKPETYLRFEYEHQGREEWLHVKDERTWY